MILTTNVTIILASLVVFVLPACPAQAETWRWSDEAGVVHFSDDHDRIPSRYRQKATVVEGTGSVNVMPAARAPERAVAEPVAAAERSDADARRKAGAEKPKKAKKEGHASTGKRKAKQVKKTVPVPTTPAREAQNRAEEQIRKDRQALDDAQLPARRAQEQAEGQIRKARDMTMGH